MSNSIRIAAYVSDKYVKRFVSCMASLDVETNLHLLAINLVEEGVCQLDLFALFSRFQRRIAFCSAVFRTGEDPRYDAIVDTMDLIASGPWAKGRALYKKVLTNEDMARIIELPEHAITLQAPWWAAILWAGKRVENRPQSVVSYVENHEVLRVALTASKSHTLLGEGRPKTRPFTRASGEVRDDVREDIDRSLDRIASTVDCDWEWPDGWSTQAYLSEGATGSERGIPVKIVGASSFAERAGHIVGVASIVGLAYPDDGVWSPWYDGRWALVLDDVQEVEPVPVIGAQNMWELTRCRCGQLKATSARCGCQGPEKRRKQLKLL